jgi:NADH-ubiquinone oxidoreductase chain 6
MLINIRTSELQINNWNSIPLASLIVIFLNVVLGEELPLLTSYFNKIKDIGEKIVNIDNYFLSSFIESYSIMHTTSNNWDGNITETSHISSIGNILYTSYNMWLFITSIILLLAMVGAIIITIKKD